MVWDATAGWSSNGASEQSSESVLHPATDVLPAFSGPSFLSAGERELFLLKYCPEVDNSRSSEEEVRV